MRYLTGGFYSKWFFYKKTFFSGNKKALQVFTMYVLRAFYAYSVNIHTNKLGQKTC